MSRFSIFVLLLALVSVCLQVNNAIADDISQIKIYDQLRNSYDQNLHTGSFTPSQDDNSFLGDGNGDVVFPPDNPGGGRPNLQPGIYTLNLPGNGQGGMEYQFPGGALIIRQNGDATGGFRLRELLMIRSSLTMLRGHGEE